MAARGIHLDAAAFQTDSLNDLGLDAGEIPPLRRPTHSQGRMRRKSVGLLRSCLRQAGGMAGFWLFF
jgi:hypothetical protein